MLIMALISSGVFSVVLTAERTTYRADRRQGAVIWAQRLNDVLQNYSGIDVDPSAQGYTFFCNACGSSCASNGCPKLSGDTCGSHVFSSGCTHNANALLPAWFKADPYKGRMCYTVNDTATPSLSTNGLVLNNVKTYVTWEDDASICPADP